MGQNQRSTHQPPDGKSCPGGFVFWGEDLEKYFNDNPNTKTAIDSIMANRHLIAHGKTATISVVRLKEYLDASIEALEYIEKQCGIK